MIERELPAGKEAGSAAEPKAQKPAKKTTSQDIQKPTEKAAAGKDVAKTDDEKRLARNAALREWRKKNKDRVKAYMTEWRARRNGKKSEEPAKSTSAAPVAIAPKGPTKKSKPTKVTKKAKAKKGGRA